jgi:transposase
MQSKTLTLKVNTITTLIVAFDVGKSQLDYYLEIPIPGTDDKKSFNGIVQNQSISILEVLAKLKTLATQNGYKQLGVVCESTGPYSNNLLQLARQQKHFTAYVSGESVYKLKVLENNDAGKTDTKDPRVILMIAKMGKVLCHRNLNGHYLALREYNRMYDYEKVQMTSIKGGIHAILIRLFVDLDFTSGFLYKNTGRAMVSLYNWNPYRMIEEGWEEFAHNMKTLAKGVSIKTLEKLWENAKTSCLKAQEPIVLQALEMKIASMYERFAMHERQIQRLEIRMTEIYRELVESGERVPKAAPNFLTEVRIARILGETGALTDYHSLNGLMKYAGLNLRERKSGQFTGAVHLSKKGRAPLRCVLGEAAFRLVKKNEIFGEYYHGKKEKGMVGTKILVAVERKLLTLFYTLGMKGLAFNRDRISICESNYKQVA